MKKVNINYIIVFLILILHFSFSVSILWDTAHYMGYVEIFEGKIPFASWDIVRGPIFPLIIYLSNLLFGKTVQGLLITTALFYLLMLYTVDKILKLVLKDENRKTAKIVMLLTFLLIIFNPIIFGYYHAILTEFVAMTLALISCFISFKWMRTTYDSKYFIIYSFFFIILTPLAWHLKQPYVSTILFPIILASIMAIIKRWQLKSILIHALVPIGCIISLFISIKGWNFILAHNGINLNTERNVTLNLGNQLLTAINNFEIVEIDNNDLSLLSEKEKDILKKDSRYKLVNVKSRSGKIVDQFILKYENDNISTVRALMVVVQNMFSNPLSLIDSYYSNYMALANLYPKVTDDGIVYYVDKKFTFKYCHENCEIAFKLNKVTNNMFYVPDERYHRVVDYSQKNIPPNILMSIFKSLEKISTIMYSFSIVVLPFILIIVFVFSLIKKIDNRLKDHIDLMLILLGYSFMHVLLHVVTGAAIDRYAAPILIPMLLGYIIFIITVTKLIIKKLNKKAINNEAI